MKQTDTNRSMAVTYDTFGRDFLDMVLSVVMVSTVVIPNDVLAGTASLLIQKETQDRTTIILHGMYVWMVK